MQGTDPNDRVHVGGQLTLGLDVNKWLSVELHGASLGKAGLSTGGNIAYSPFGISGLFYAGKNRHQYNRRGLSGFGRAGLGYLSNKASTGVNYEKDNAAHLLLGIGLEFATARGLAVRAETIVFDADVNYTQLGLLYRFGQRNKRQREMIVQVPVEKTANLIPPVAAIAVTPTVLDGDDDGVIDQLDDCPTTKINVAVNISGCALFSGVIEGVNFHTSSAKLTNESIDILSSVAQTLQAYPLVNFTLTAHTDSQGSEQSNLKLSQQRAESVANYLVNTGIAKERFTTTAYGEAQPIANNSTAEGRLKNRRVELNATR